MASTFYKRYPAFLVGTSTWDVAVGTLLPVLSTIDKWSQAGMFGIWHELDRDLKNLRTQILAEFCLDLQGKIQILSHTLIESSYDFILTLLIHKDADIRILSCQGFSYKNIISLFSNQMRDTFDSLYQYRILGQDKLGSSTVDEIATMLCSML